jgi:hypothetical protein
MGRWCENFNFESHDLDLFDAPMIPNTVAFFAECAAPKHE